MTLEEIEQFVNDFEKLAQVKPEAPQDRAARDAKNREVREVTREIKALADNIERKYSALKSIGFFREFATIRELKRVRSTLASCNSNLDRLF